MTFWWWFAQHAATTALGIMIVLGICRLVPNRPGLAHVLWAALLIKFVVPPLVAWPWLVPALSARDVNIGDFGESSRPRLERPVEEPAAAIEAPAPSVTTEHSPTTTTETTGELSSTAPSSIAPSVMAPLTDLPNVDSPAAAAIIPAAPIDSQVIEPPADVAPLVDIDQQASPATTPWLDVPQRVWRSGELGRLVTRGFVSIWISGAFVSLVVQVWRIRRMTALIKCGTAAPERLQGEVARVAEALGMRPVAVVVSEAIPGPFIWCWGSARLVWPAALVDEASISRLRGVIAHELAHVRRRDHWFAWLEMAVGIVWWFHPLCWFVRRRLHESAEMACDALAVSAAPDGRRAYAESLVALSSYGELKVVAPALGAGSRDARVIHRRLMMILSNRVNSGLTWRGWLAATVLTIAVLPNWSLGQAAVPAAPGAKPEPAPAAETTTTETTATETTTTETTETAPAAETPELARETGREVARLQAQVEQLLAERVALGAHHKALEQALEQRVAELEKMREQLQIVQRRAKRETVAAAPTTVEAAPESDDGAPRTTRTRGKGDAAAGVGEVDPSSVASLDRIDLMSLGIAIVEARGDVSIAEQEYQDADRANSEGQTEVTKSEARIAKIHFETALSKYKLLHTIAEAAREAAADEVQAQEEALVVLKQLRDQAAIPVQEVLTAAAKLRNARGRLKLIETLLSQ